jgi:hypothetical protein
MFEVKIGGLKYSISRVNTDLEVCHAGSGRKLWGEISYDGQSIRILKASPERELRVLLHELIHGVISEYNIPELINPDGDHSETAIDQLSIGLAEVLESLGITSLYSTNERGE